MRKKNYSKPDVELYHVSVGSLLNDVSDVVIGGEGEADSKKRLDRKRRIRDWDNPYEWDEEEQNQVSF